MSQRTFTKEPFHVSPELIGAPIASPLRRGVAFGIDLLLIILPSLAVALGAAGISLSLTEPRAFDGMRALLFGGRQLEEQARREAFQNVLPLLARHEAPGMPCAAKEAFEQGRNEEALEMLRDYDFEFLLQFGEFEKPLTKPKTIRIEIGQYIPKSFRFIAIYGVAAAYFGLFSITRRGATLGKRWTGIRVVRLDGHRLSIAEALERFVGYLHIPGSLGISLLDLWRDPNRRLPHDRVVHTAVLQASANRNQAGSKAKKPAAH
jgi:hypothetical protein